MNLNDLYEMKDPRDAYQRDYDSSVNMGKQSGADVTGEEEPSGIFTVMVDGRPWKTGSSNEMFSIADRVANKYPDKKIAVKWPTGQLNAVKPQGVAEGMESSPAASAITRRILLQRTDLLSKYGPEKVTAAIDEVADFVGDVEEIGSSDVSGWVRHVEQILGNTEDSLNELSTEKLAQYKKAAHADAKKSDADGNYARGDKRFKGINQATNKQFDNDLKKHGQQGMAEGKADYNFDAEDLKRLERIRDLPTLKTQALALISKPSAKPMKPEKVEWFKNALERMNSPLKVIKLMYDLLLSGEGHAVVGSKSSMNPNSYQQRFSEESTDKAGIPGSVPTEKIPGKEDLLRGRGRSYYEDQKNPGDDWYDEEDQDTELRSGDYVRDQQDGESGEVFRMQGDPYERRVRILDRDGRGWYIEPGRLTRVDPADPDVQRYFGKQRVRDMDESAVAEAKVDRDGHSVDHADSGEYDYEGDQARDQINTIVRAARKLDGLLDDDENMPEWVQMKVTLAADYLDTAADYIESNQAPELDDTGHSDDYQDIVARLQQLAGAK